MTLERDAGPLWEMSMGVRLCAGGWQVIGWLLRTVISTGRGAIQNSSVLCRGTAYTAALLLTAESGLRAGRPVCQERVGMTALCVRQAVRQSVQGSLQACAGTEGQLLLLLPWPTRRLPVCGQHTEATARGASAQKHRSCQPH